MRQLVDLLRGDVIVQERAVLTLWLALRFLLSIRRRFFA
jgi:hypothetical protein